MSFLRNGPFFDWQCDFCNFEMQTEGDSFREAFADAKRYGWQAIKDKNGDWQHKCATCRGLDGANLER